MTVQVTQPQPLACETDLSDAVLQAARDAITKLGDPYTWIQVTDPGPVNRPLLPLLMALLDAAEATANAVAENSWDVPEPVDAKLTRDLAKQCGRITLTIASSVFLFTDQ